ncbi:MAG: mechanosensitive ion channel family protein [Thermoguttaceae bacterium]|nr:mechanosensitive ion channel family protein [Thermoguttaceae bacterium]
MKARFLAFLVLFLSFTPVWAQNLADLGNDLVIEDVSQDSAEVNASQETTPQTATPENETPKAETALEGEKADEEKPSSKVEKIFNSDDEVVDITVDADEIPDEAKPENDVMVQSSIEAAEKARESDPAKTEEGADEKADFVAEELPEELPEEEPEAPAADPAAASKQPAAAAAGSYETLTPLEIALQKTLKNPRVTVNFFIEKLIQNKYDEAILAMDFSAQPDLSKLERHNLAYQLLGILSRLDHFQLNGIPEKYDRNECYLMPDKNYHAIVLTRQPDGTWRFGTATVADIPTFYDKIKAKTPNFIRKTWMAFLPEFMFHHYCGMALIQWCMFFIAVCFGILAAWWLPKICTYLTLLCIHLMNGRKEYTPYIQRVYSPLAIYAMFGIWYFGLLYSGASPVILRNALLVLHPLGIFFLMISLLRAVDVFAFWFRKRLEQTRNKTVTVLVDITTGGLKFLVVCLGIVLVAEVFGFSPLGIISGMGIGGVAVALAAQQTISNFFGSLTILLDRPFTVGDRIVIGNVEGTVESIGVRSTRIRTLYDSSVIIPNGTLSTDTIDNLGRRAAHRFRTMLTVTYDTTPEKLQEFCENIKKILKEDPAVLEERSVVSVYDFSESSIDILFNTFFRAENGAEEFAIRERLLIAILTLANETGVDFAFPTQTNYVISEKN